MTLATKIPDPLVPPECDLRSFPYTPLYRARLFGSRFHATVSDAGWRAGVTVWLKSWDQVPAGSLPSDDVLLCRLAELGRDLRQWKKIREEALHGWVECSDGRLYHHVVAELVLEAWKSRGKASARGKAGAVARWGSGIDPGSGEASPNDASSIEQASTKHSNRTEQKGTEPNPSPTSNPILKDLSTPASRTNGKSGFLVGNGLGNGGSERNAENVTIDDPKERLARFQQKIAQQLGACGWDIVTHAVDVSDPEHDRCLALCKAAAREIGKGWPRAWV